jgi:hypothetical protein
MILTILTLVLSNFLIFFFLLLIFSYLMKQISITKKSFFSGFISSTSLIYFLNYSGVIFIQTEIIIISIMIFLPFLFLFNIYFPLLLDRSFSISILLDLSNNKSLSPKKIIKNYKKNFPIFIERRIKDLLKFNFILIVNKKLKLTNKGIFLVSIMRLIKKIYRI